MNDLTAVMNFQEARSADQLPWLVCCLVAVELAKLSKRKLTLEISSNDGDIICVRDGMNPDVRGFPGLRIDQGITSPGTVS